MSIGSALKGVGRAMADNPGKTAAGAVGGAAVANLPETGDATIQVEPSTGAGQFMVNAKNIPDGMVKELAKYAVGTDVIAGGDVLSVSTDGAQGTEAVQALLEQAGMKLVPVG